jgi:hypothetical protein
MISFHVVRNEINACREGCVLLSEFFSSRTTWRFFFNLILENFYVILLLSLQFSFKWNKFELPEVQLYSIPWRHLVKCLLHKMKVLWSISRPGRFTAADRAPGIRFDKKLGEFQGVPGAVWALSRGEKCLSPAGNQTPFPRSSNL